MRPSKLRLSMILALFCVVGPVRAEVAVLFADGRSLQVAGVAIEDSVAYLSLEGGGEIAVPAERLVEWQEIPAEVVAQAPSREAAVGPPGWRETAGPYADAIEDAARRHGLDPALLAAVAQVESAFDAGAISPKGARGLLQLMPDTARRFGVDDAFDAMQNIDGGARYLGWLLERYGGSTELALAGYNAGEGAVDRFDGIPPYRETRTYVDRVMSGAAMLARSQP